MQGAEGLSAPAHEQRCKRWPERSQTKGAPLFVSFGECELRPSPFPVGRRPSARVRHWHVYMARLRRMCVYICAAHVVGLYSLLIALFLVRRSSTVNVKESTRLPCADAAAADAVHFSYRVVLPGGVSPALIRVSSGRIASAHIASLAEATALARKFDIPLADHGDAAVSPGLVDVHAHVSGLGDRGWEGYESATRAAAAGGVTTIVAMPLVRPAGVSNQI